MFKSIARENMALSLSAVAAGLFALAGITWGLWIDSLVILFDGAYSLVSLMLSLLSLYAARVVRRPASKEYPFGHGAVEPLVIAIKGLVITLVCLLSLASAIAAMLEGGRAVSADRALVFASVSVLGCAAVWVYLNWAECRESSGLLVAEKRQWFMDSVLSAAVLLGFGIAWWLEQSAWSAWAVYADPVMMIVISAYFILVPIKMTAGAVRELMLAAPSAEFAEEVHEALHSVGLAPEQVKMAKVGPSLMMEISLPANWPGHSERLKGNILRHLEDLPVRPAIFMRRLIR
ncbi:cation diffusion facilitator family transporter [Marinobacter sp. ANT_B65]|uniref:cation diffusion facilitator family transporter n=1 Tax=Marinobacter sp. ANT_B65 TaxID=2039467 RepID=UPI000BBEE9FE|nr:cation diffusion facilitator family transporter [Marinobacter sp. ANT_B65]PCM44339.1 cation transporter [Marinobacter sp. ANT_B65]